MALFKTKEEKEKASRDRIHEKAENIRAKQRAKKEYEETFEKEKHKQTEKRHAELLELARAKGKHKAIPLGTRFKTGVKSGVQYTRTKGAVVVQKTGKAVQAFAKGAERVGGGLAPRPMRPQQMQGFRPMGDFIGGGSFGDEKHSLYFGGSEGGAPLDYFGQPESQKPVDFFGGLGGGSSDAFGLFNMKKPQYSGKKKKGSKKDLWGFL